MTTSPFGTPNPFASPSSESSSAAGPSSPGPGAPATSSVKTPVLIGLVGVAALAAVGTGLYFFSQSGSSVDDVVAAPPPSSAPSDSPVATPTQAPTPLPTLTEFNGRNPFAALVVEGGEGAAPASTPAATSAPVSTGSSAYTGGAGGGSLAVLPGTDGKDGVDGTNGRDGRNGRDGKDGKTPQLATLTLVGGDAVSGEADFTLRSDTQQFDVADLPVGEFLGTTAPGSWVEYTAKGADADADGVLDGVTIQMGDAVYTVALGETVLLWQYTG